jgi:pimeloyl-[acyl-carrier protein] methyl ester esterase
MKPIQLVFCHGFGMDQSFWRNLAQYFEGYDCVFWDLGYFRQEELIIAPNFIDYQVIAIGHSFGVLKLLNYSADLNTNLNTNFQAIISLQGFRNFLGNKALLNKKRQLQWWEMRVAFDHDAKGALLQFYDRVFDRDNILHQELIAKIDQLNLKKISLDLDCLIVPSRSEFNKILSIGSLDDKIVPPILIRDNFAMLNNAKIIMHDGGNHLLGFLEAEFVAQEIKVFLDEIKN